MIPVKKSYTSESDIVAMGVRLVQAMKETGQEYLMLNRGVNAVTHIDIGDIAKTIDFNSPEIQVYPSNKGKVELRQAINDEFFNQKAHTDNILVTAGGISGLDICIQNIAVKTIWLPPLFWGTYHQLTKLRNLETKSYKNYEWLAENGKKLTGSAVVICDPGNPGGEKYPDEKLYEVLHYLNSHQVVVLFDSPYRRLFYDKTDGFYQKLLNLENVIIIESFSKSVGLSGQRIGFIHSTNPKFIDEATLRLMYATNGINAFAQTVMTKLLVSEEGIQAVSAFKMKTTRHISMNINFLKENNLLAQKYYTETEPLGIFAIVNRSPEELFKHRIGSVGLDYFTLKPFEGMEKLSRILVSYPNEKFVSFMRTIL